MFSIAKRSSFAAGIAIALLFANATPASAQTPDLPGANAFIVRKTVRLALFGLLVLAVVMAGAGWMFRVTPTGFLPAEDQGAVFGEVQLPEGASVSRTDVVTRRAEEIIRKTPGVASVTSVTGYNLIDGQVKSDTALLANKDDLIPHPPATDRPL